MNKTQQAVIHHFTPKSVENIEMTKKGLKNEGASMKLALYKGYSMSNLARIGLNYTANFVWKFHKLLVASGGVRIVIRP